MADTLGGLIDKLITIDMKMWTNQEFIFEVRRMTFQEFCQKFTMNTEQKKSLYDSVKKVCDLNNQRNALIDEIDEKVVKMIESANKGEELDAGKFIQRKHKTY